MVKVDIISGFLGAGKTTLIKKLFEGAFKNEKVALIENEFGEIGVDGAFLKEVNVNVKEINSGCICCSLSGDFKKALSELIETYEPTRIIIEPSGVGKLSDVVSAVESVDGVLVNVLCTVVDGNKIKMYHKNFGEFYLDQIVTANTIVLSKIENFTEQKLIETCEYIKQFNPTATIITTPVLQLDGKLLLENLEDSEALMKFVISMLKKNPENHHHEHHHDHDEHCDCHEHEHHHHGEHCDCHEHEHHHHGEHCDCHEHEHHHHGEHCECGCHHHHAEEVFESYYKLTPLAFTKKDLEIKLKLLDNGSYGIVLRAKGVVKGDSGWLHFDYVPNSYEVRDGSADAIGKICVIGTNLNKENLETLFGE